MAGYASMPPKEALKASTVKKPVSLAKSATVRPIDHHVTPFIWSPQT
jgi:hypothetical protein